MLRSAGQSLFLSPGRSSSPSVISSKFTAIPDSTWSGAHNPHPAATVGATAAATVAAAAVAAVTVDSSDFSEAFMSPHIDASTFSTFQPHSYNQLYAADSSENSLATYPHGASPIEAFADPEATPRKASDPRFARDSTLTVSGSMNDRLRMASSSELFGISTPSSAATSSSSSSSNSTFISAGSPSVTPNSFMDPGSSSSSSGGLTPLVSSLQHQHLGPGSDGRSPLTFQFPNSGECSNWKIRLFSRNIPTHDCGKLELTDHPPPPSRFVILHSRWSHNLAVLCASSLPVCPSAGVPSSSSRTSSLKRMAADLEDSRSLRRPASFPVLSAHAGLLPSNPHISASGGGGTQWMGDAAPNGSPAHLANRAPPSAGLAPRRVASVFPLSTGSSSLTQPSMSTQTQAQPQLPSQYQEVPASGQAALSQQRRSQNFASPLGPSGAEHTSGPSADLDTEHHISRGRPTGYISHGSSSSFGGSASSGGFTFSVPHGNAWANADYRRGGGNPNQTSAVLASSSGANGTWSLLPSASSGGSPIRSAESAPSASALDISRRYSSSDQIANQRGANSAPLPTHSLPVAVSSEISPASSRFPQTQHLRQQPSLSQTDSGHLPARSQRDPSRNLSAVVSDHTQNPPPLIRATQLPSVVGSQNSYSVSPPRKHPALGTDWSDFNSTTSHATQGHPSERAKPIHMPATVWIENSIDAYTHGWTQDEHIRGRRLVQFWRKQEGVKISVMSEAVTPNTYVPGSVTLSCILRRETGEFFVTSVDALFLLESIVNSRFSIEEKNRIRRNLEGFKPKTVSKSRPETEGFFKQIMNYPAPKPRNIEKDVKIFPWHILEPAIVKIVSKYSALVDPNDETAQHLVLSADDSGQHQRTSSTSSSSHRNSGHSAFDERLSMTSHGSSYSFASSIHPHIGSPHGPMMPLTESDGATTDSSQMSQQNFIPQGSLSHSNSFPGPSSQAPSRSSYSASQPPNAHQHHQSFHHTPVHGSGSLHGSMASHGGNQGEPSSFLPFSGTVHTADVSPPGSSDHYQHHSSAPGGQQLYGQDVLPPSNSFAAHQSYDHGAANGIGYGRTSLPSYPHHMPSSAATGDYYLMQSEPMGNALSGFAPR